MTLYRFAVEELEFGRGAATIPVADCGPAEEVQLDTEGSGGCTEHGEEVGRFAQRLLEGPLPWTRMRRVYALLGFARRYGAGVGRPRVPTPACGFSLQLR